MEHKHGAVLVPDTGAMNSFCGFVRAQGHEFGLRVRTSSRGVPRAVQCDAALQQLLAPHLRTLRTRMLQSANVEQFIMELEEVLDNVLRARPPASTPSATFFERLLAEVNELGWDHIVELDASLSQMQLQLTDGAGRQHLIGVSLPARYPMDPPLISTDLPRPLVLRWQHSPGASKFVMQGQSPSFGLGDASLDVDGGGDATPMGSPCGLRDVLSQFGAALEVYQGFWDELDVIDARTWVLEPEHVTRSASVRRLAVAAHCSIQVELDAAQPRAPCACRVLGPDAVAGPMRQALARNMQGWDTGHTVLQNLEAVLERRFPSPENTARETFRVECGICYAHRLSRGGSGDGEGGPDEEACLPECCCENKKCARAFHQPCLFEWLQGLPDSRRSFNTIFGPCPYCGEILKVSSVG